MKHIFILMPFISTFYIGDCFMKKVSLKQKRWNMLKSHKAMKALSKRKNKKRYIAHSGNYSYYSSKKHILCVPKNLSLNTNEEETIHFFEKALEVGKKCSVNHQIYFDLQNVENITADAVMYIIAFINNFKRLKILNIHIAGNLPINDSARLFLEDVGFYSYVSGLKRTHSPNIKDRFQISHGKNADGELAGKICNFVNNVMGKKDLISTKRLYPMIMELMTNTRQHAYNKNKIASIMDCNWYIFAERLDNYINFIFLDTGVGIPTTLWYNNSEKISKLFSGKKKDAAFIASALRGEFRTETGKSHRGKGLPGIYQDSINGRIHNMSIISGKGKCTIMNNGEIKEKVLPISFEGTLFCWKYNIK